MEYISKTRWTGHSWLTTYHPVLSEEEKNRRYDEAMEVLKEIEKNRRS